MFGARWFLPRLGGKFRSTRNRGDCAKIVFLSTYEVDSGEAETKETLDQSCREVEIAKSLTHVATIGLRSA